MLYCILIYNAEAQFEGLTKEEDDALVAQHFPLHAKLKAQSKLGPVVRLSPSAAATTLRNDGSLVLDGPYAETKEQLLGLYLVDCASMQEAIETARQIPSRCVGALEIRPVSWFDAGLPEVAGQRTTAPRTTEA